MSRCQRHVLRPGLLSLDLGLSEEHAKLVCRKVEAREASEHAKSLGIYGISKNHQKS